MYYLQYTIYIHIYIYIYIYVHTHIYEYIHYVYTYMHIIQCASSFACFGLHKKNKKILSFNTSSVLYYQIFSVSLLVSSSNLFFSLGFLFLPCNVHL